MYSKRIVTFLLAVFIGLWGSMVFAALPTAVNGNPLPTLAPMLEQATPAVVNISTRVVKRGYRNALMDDPFFRHFFDLPRQEKRESVSAGSGVVVDAKLGYILTNHHVIDNADEIVVTLADGRHFKANLIGSDSETDVAVIRIPADKLTALPIGDSDALRVGDFVVAVGNPFGLGQTVTSGIVSALGRSGLGIEGYEDFIQTDASINPGNSGGALVNLRGELVGINTAILAPNGGNVGIGFAIPVTMAEGLMQQIIQYGEVRRGVLGVSVQDLTPDLAAAFGVTGKGGAIVSEVSANSSADQAGLRTGDIVLKINDRPVKNGADLRNRIGILRAGQRVRLDVLRNGRSIRLSAVIATIESTAKLGRDIHPVLAGARLSDLPTQGIEVVTVERNTKAWSIGLRKGDLIIGANRYSVNSTSELQKVLTSSNGLLFRIQRDDSIYLIQVR